MDVDIATIIQLGVPLLAVGGAWGTTKAVQNGLKSRVKELEVTKEDVVDRLARIETKLDILMEKK